jgi:hypothetical protein
MGIVLWMTFQSEIVIPGMITAQLSMVKFWHTVISAARETLGKKETCSYISAQKLAFLRISDWWCDLDIPDQSYFAGNHQFCSGSSCFSLDRSKGKMMLKMVSGRIFLMGPLQTGLQRHALMTKRLSVQCEAHSCVVLVTDWYKTTPSHLHPPCSLSAKTLCLCASMPLLVTKSWLCSLWLVYCCSNAHFIPWNRLTQLQQKP